MAIGFPSGSKNFCNFFVFLAKLLFCTDTTGSKSCTIAYRWLIRDSHPSLRTSWSAVIKSPKFSERSTILPIRLLQEALVILVFWQISQFRSSGKWVDVGSKDGSWEELACVSLHSGILSSTRFSLNSCSHSGISEQNGSHRSLVVFVFIWFLIFVWLGKRVSPFFLFNMFTWHRYWMEIFPTQVFPCSSLTVAWHSCGWWSRRAGGRFGTINFLSLRCHGCWSKQAWGRIRWQTRNHDWYEVFPYCTVFEKPFLWVGVFDRWSTHMSIHVHRKAFVAIKLLSYPRGLELSRKNQFFDRHRGPSSCVCTSPLVVMTIVGPHDFVKVHRGFTI